MSNKKHDDSVFFCLIPININYICIFDDDGMRIADGRAENLFTIVFPLFPEVC